MVSKQILFLENWTENYKIPYLHSLLWQLAYTICTKYVLFLKIQIGRFIIQDIKYKEEKWFPVLTRIASFAETNKSCQFLQKEQNKWSDCCCILFLAFLEIVDSEGHCIFSPCIRQIWLLRKFWRCAYICREYTLCTLCINYLETQFVFSF